MHGRFDELLEPAPALARPPDGEIAHASRLEHVDVPTDAVHGLGQVELAGSRDVPWSRPASSAARSMIAFISASSSAESAHPCQTSA